MAGTTIEHRSEKVLPTNRYHRSDSTPHLAFDLNKVSASDLTRKVGISKRVASQVVALRRRKPIGKTTELLGLERLSMRDYEKLRRRGLGKEDSRFAIDDVQPAQEHIFSHRPFAMRVSFVNPAGRNIVIASVSVLWQGRPFTVEQRVTARDRARGHIDVRFSRQRALPSGPAAFLATLYDSDGGQSSFKVTCVVLPSNPLSLSISPSTYYVTGTYSARGYYDSGSNTYKTVIRVSIYNGNATSVSLPKRMKWWFWDGGVGGTLKESGTHVFGSGNLSVPAYGSWSATLTFSSPPGSGIHETYDNKEDMTIAIEMQTTAGLKISDTITARVMLAYGADIVRVAGDTFVGQEYTDLYDAVEVMRDIYEARDIGLRGVGKYHIDDADAGNYKYMNSQDECGDLFRDWSAAPDGSYIDVFVAHDFIGVGFDGLAGGVPGPTSHAGRKSGVVVDKTGYVDGLGKKRLSVDYLGMLIGHELGHYLGLPHISDSGNLMLASSGTTDTNLTYDQYRTIAKHGWIFGE